MDVWTQLCDSADVLERVAAGLEFARRLGAGNVVVA